MLNDGGRETRTGAAFRVLLVGYCTIVVSLIAIGLLITNVLDRSVGRWDNSANRWLVGQRGDLANSVTGAVTFALNTLPVIAIAVVAVGILLWRRQIRAATLIVIALILEITVFLTVNFVVARPRPDVLRLDSTPTTSSFPSGHTAAAVVLYGGIALAITWCTRRTGWRVAFWTLAVVAGLGAAFSRTYRGMHHPTDVVAGLAYGAACLWLAALAIRASFGPEPEGAARGPVAADHISRASEHPGAEHPGLAEPQGVT